MRLWRKLTSLGLVTRFWLLALLCIVAFSAFFAYAFSTYLRSYGEDREASLTASYVRQVVQENVPAELFSRPVTPSATEAWGRVSSSFLFGDIFRVKVYDRRGVIIWSDEKRLIGRRFDDHPMLKKALDGQVVSKFEKPNRPEHVYERDPFQCVAEVYVPIFAVDESGDLLGVVETYRHPENFLQSTKRATILNWVASLFGALILFAVLSKIVHNAHRRQVRLQDELKKNAAALAGEKQLLGEILNGLDAGVMVVDPREKLVWANDTMGKWFSDLFTLREHDSLCAPHACDLCDSVRAVLGGTHRDERDHTLSTPNEGRRSFQIVTSAIRDTAGSITMVVQLVHDVTARRLVEGQLIQVSKMAAVGEMATKVAHEINNPIGVISGLVKVLLARRQKVGIPEQVAEDLVRVSTQADRISHVVRSLLAFSRPGTNEKSLCDINSIAKDCLTLSGRAFQSFKVNIRLEFEEDLPKVWVDAKRLQQVFVNLLNNAVDAMPTGGEILLSNDLRMAEGQGHFVRVRVADTGKGVPPEIKDQIFDPFFTTKAPGKGTGLGLSVSDEIIREHDGSLTLESSGPEGSVFLIELPAQVKMETPDQLDAHGLEGGHAAARG